MKQWLWRLKWALLIAIFAGPALAYMSWEENKRVSRVLEQGVEYTALVEGGVVREGRRGSRSYKLDVSWTDSDGAPHRETIDISSAMADRVFGADMVLIDTTQIKVLPDAPPAVIVEDAAAQLSGGQSAIWLALGAGLVGLIFAPLWFWLEHRDKKRDEDIDTMLAQMRSGQAQQP